MFHRLYSLDRRRALSLGLIIGSTALLVVGIIGVLVTLSKAGVDLPAEGSINDIVSEAATGTSSNTPGEETPRTGPPPVRLAIPGLYIDAPVITEGLGEDKLPRVPERPDQVAWYDFTSTPGIGNNAVFTGHVDWQTANRVPIPGVFYRLREMKLGDEIDVTLEDGSSLRYRVTGNVATAYDDPNVLRVMGPTTNDVITLITCGGSWVGSRSSPNGGNYSHRIIVRAERVLDAVSAAAD